MRNDNNELNTREVINPGNPISFILSTILAFVIEKIFSRPLEMLVMWLTSNDCFLSQWLYKRIAMGTPVNIPFYLLIITVVAITCFIINKYKTGTQINCEEMCKKCSLQNRLFSCFALKCKKRFKEKKGYRLLIAAVWFVWLVFISLTNYVNLSETRIQNNIEIIAPYISELEYKELKSEWHSIENYSDYNALMNIIDEYGEDNELLLQK